MNCTTCMTGSRWWIKQPDGSYVCPMCECDPTAEGVQRDDWEDFIRAKAVAQFGPRRPGDAELLERYAKKLKGTP